MIQGIVRNIRTRMGLEKSDFQNVFEKHAEHEPECPEKSLFLRDRPFAKLEKHKEHSCRNRPFGIARPADDTQNPWEGGREGCPQAESDSMVERPENPVIDRQGENDQEQEEKDGP